MSRIALLKMKSFHILIGIILIVGAGMAIAVDSDGDGMSDVYSRFFRIDPSSGMDNCDTDSLVNRQEALLWTDPRAADTDTDELNDGSDSNALSRAVMWWGSPDFTLGDEYFYTGPDWWLGAGKAGGSWLADGGWQVSSNEQGILYIDVDRSLVTNNLMLNLMHDNAVGSLVYLGLTDCCEGMVAADLYGDLTSDDGTRILSRYMLPLAEYPAASRIIIDATAGGFPYTVWASTLYEDADADGLDADQEVQFGTLDTNPDSDGDGLIDYVEIFSVGTDPLNSDTDGDGFSDAKEFYELGTSPTVPMWQEGGLSGMMQSERWETIFGGTMGWLFGSDLFGGDSAKVLWTSDCELPENQGRYYGLRMRGTITAPAAGTYTFYLTGDDVAQVWISDDESPYNRRLFLELRNWTAFEDLADPDAVCARMELASNQTCYVEVLLKQDRGGDHVSLWWTRPGEQTPEIVGSQYLHSYVQPQDDADMDGLPDDWELAHGLDPEDGSGGGYRDSDGNGLMDIEDYQFELNPIRSGYPGKLLAERWGGFLGETMLSLVDSDLFGGDPDFLYWTGACEFPQSKWSRYGLRMRGTIRMPVDGRYSFALTGDDVAQVWMSGDENPYNRQLILDLDSATAFRDLSDPDVPTVEMELPGNQVCYVEILLKESSGGDHVSLWWKRPGREHYEVIGWEYISSYVQPNDDADADGLPDAWEAAVGLDAQSGVGGGYQDSDGDWYSDLAEYQNGTDPLDPDSDDDGLIDAVERTITGTSPGSPDSDSDGIGDLETLVSLNGAQTGLRHDGHYMSVWSTVGDSVQLSGMLGSVKNAYVTYLMDTPIAGMGQVDLHVSFPNGRPTLNNCPSVRFSIDGNTAAPVYATLGKDGNLVYSLITPWLTVTNADYDGTGVYNFRLFHPNEESASVCHTYVAYQDGQLIGEIFGGKQ
ncbi:MAG: hypothetical protein JXR25_06630 [Pontiellaceae bacterium]|nr:hypothetical protein [Pontiellaceae bacterium]MBN2784485.1 hypothetical protein [Pontiellaceae bacterium]